MFRKMAHGHFCSESHRKAYQDEQEQLVLARLAEAPSPRAVQPSNSTLIDFAVWEDTDKSLPMQGLLRSSLTIVLGETPQMVSVDPVTYDAEGAWAMSGLTQIPEFHLAPRSAGKTKVPVNALDWFGVRNDSRAVSVSFKMRQHPSFGFVQSPEAFDFTTIPVIVDPPAAAEEAPAIAGSIPLTLPAPRFLRGTVNALPAPISAAGILSIPTQTTGLLSGLPGGTLLPLPIFDSPLVHGVWMPEDFAVIRRPQDLTPQIPVLPALIPRVPFGAVADMEMPLLETTAQGLADIAPAIPPPEISLPVSGASVLNEAPVEQPRTDPPFAVLTHLPYAQAWKECQFPAHTSSFGNEAFGLVPRVQDSSLSPLDPPRVPSLPANAATSILFRDTPPASAWTPIKQLWRNTPTDVRVVAGALPFLIFLVFNPYLPKVRVSSNSRATPANFSSVLQTHLVSMRENVSGRAGVELVDDFRSGMDRWQTRENQANGWFYDQNGFVHPGDIALYQPSIGLRDYEFQFAGQLNKGALSWAVRALNPQNYYAIKIQIVRPGPNPVLGLVRYAVINGVEGKHYDSYIPHSLRSESLMTVKTSVRGDVFTVSLGGEVITSWSDDQLPTGGVGFFSDLDKGEESSIRWVQITHQYDALGRLCAFLAP